MALTAEDIRKAKKGKAGLARELVPVPAWGGEVWVRALTGAERDGFEAANSRVVGSGKARRIEPRLDNYRARLVVLGACHESGANLFDEDDVGWLSQESAEALDALVDAIHRLSGMKEESVEQAEKNSAATPGG
jgi:hypothetical protein